MRVNLGGGDVGMPQQRLQRPQVGAACQQVRRESMAQDMGTNAVRSDAGIGCQGTDDLEEANAAQMGAAAREEPDRVLRAGVEPPLNSLQGPARHRNEAFLGALALEDHEWLASPHRMPRQR